MTTHGGLRGAADEPRAVDRCRTARRCHLVSSTVKLFVPKEKLADVPRGGWIADFSAGAVKTLGVIEILGALGLILPAALDIAPVLVPLAAAGLVLLMAGAMITHPRRHETAKGGGDLVYLAMAASWRGAGSAPSPF